MDRMDYFLELFGELPRAGPGDDASTRRAFEMMDGLPPAPRILDVGCGPGAQTLVLLEISAGNVTALDLLPQMISRVESAAAGAGFADRLQTVEADMSEMEFEPESFDVVWSEGAVYVLGFEAGLARFRDLVKPGGYVAVTEPVWLAHDPPLELREFWQQYPAIDTVDAKTGVVARAGYERVGEFVLPAESWTVPYYDPLERRLRECEPTWKGVAEADDVMEEARTELAMFRKYRRYYSYAFFVMRRPSG